jgi:hypothetical protein
MSLSPPFFLEWEMARFNPGFRIGSFVLDKRIGDGAFASVWRAHHAVASTTVAVK